MRTDYLCTLEYDLPMRRPTLEPIYPWVRLTLTLSTIYPWDLPMRQRKTYRCRTIYPWADLPLNQPTLDLSLDEVEEGILVELNVVMDGAEAALVLVLGGEGGGSQVAVHRSVQKGLRLSCLQLPHVLQHWFPRLWHIKKWITQIATEKWQMFY